MKNLFYCMIVAFFSTQCTFGCQDPEEFCTLKEKGRTVVSIGDNLLSFSPLVTLAGIGIQSLTPQGVFAVGMVRGLLWAASLSVYGFTTYQGASWTHADEQKRIFGPISCTLRAIKNCFCPGNQLPSGSL